MDVMRVKLRTETSKLTQKALCLHYCCRTINVKKLWDSFCHVHTVVILLAAPKSNAVILKDAVCGAVKLFCILLKYVFIIFSHQLYQQVRLNKS